MAPEPDADATGSDMSRLNQSRLGAALTERDELLRRLTAAEAERDRLRSALLDQLEFWKELPCGFDEDADPDDNSPDDAIVHIAGLAVRAARKALDDDPMSSWLPADLPIV